MASYTTNYQLHQWEASDDFLRTDFNDDFLIIDNAIKAVSDASASGLASLDATKAEFVTGNYVGTNGTQSINLGFRPTALLISSDYYTTAVNRNSGHMMLTLTSTGFSAQDIGDFGSATPNALGDRYTYLAMR